MEQKGGEEQPAEDALSKAFDLVEEHFGRRSDRGGRPYIGHLLRVAGEAAISVDAGSARDALIAGLLHDLVEDRNPTLEDLRRAGFPGRVIDAVGLVTKPPGLDGDDETAVRPYLEGIKKDTLALAVKRADIRDNLDERRAAELSDDDRPRLRRRYEMYLRILDND